MKYDQDITLPACTFSKAGCYLMGWTTKENGSGDFYYDGEKARNFTAEDGVVLDLYAQYNPGNGSADSPWLIDTQATWGILAERVRKGVDSYKYYKMTADVTAPISRMMGTSSHPFNGHFDGDGHNLTINFDAREEDIYAPFKYVNQASFRNLTVSGSIVLDEGYLSAGGFIGDVTHEGTVTLMACRSKVFGLCHWSGSFGGFIGRTAGSGNVVFIDCLSDATVSSYPYPTQVAYFVGVAESGSNISFRNCLETAQKH